MDVENIVDGVEEVLPVEESSEEVTPAEDGAPVAEEVSE